MATRYASGVRLLQLSASFEGGHTTVVQPHCAALQVSRRSSKTPRE